MFARIGATDISVLKYTFQETQSEVGTFEVTVPLQEIDRASVQFSDVAVYRRGIKVSSGITLEACDVAFTEQGIATARIRCFSELGRLTCTRADSDAHFQDQLVIAAVAQLLAFDGNWALNDVSTMDDPTIKITIDLRSKETLFAQVSEIMRAIPRLFLRYNGFDSLLGKHALAIGFFGERSIPLVAGDGLIAMKVQARGKRLYRRVEAYSGRSSSRRVSLQDALAYPGILTHPDYAQFPIVIVGTKYLCVNNATPLGCDITKEFNVLKTKNDGAPTPAEQAEVGFSLWRRTVQFLLQNQSNDVYTIQGFSGEIPRISDSIYVKGDAKETAFDYVTLCERTITTFSVNNWIRLTRLSGTYDSAGLRPDSFQAECPTNMDIYDFELTDNDYLNIDDPDVEQQESLAANDSADVLTAGSGILATQTVTVTHLTTDPADGACAPDTAKEFVFPFSAPVGAVTVLGLIQNSSPLGVGITITQYPSLPATPLIACVQLGGTWPGASDVSVTALYLYT